MRGETPHKTIYQILKWSNKPFKVHFPIWFKGNKHFKVWGAQTPLKIPLWSTYLGLKYESDHINHTATYTVEWRKEQRVPHRTIAGVLECEVPPHTLIATMRLMWAIFKYVLYGRLRCTIVLGRVVHPSLSWKIGCTPLYMHRYNFF